MADMTGRSAILGLSERHKGTSGSLCPTARRWRLGEPSVGPPRPESRSLESGPLAISAVGDTRRLQRAIDLLFGSTDKYLGARLNLLALAHLVGHYDGLRRDHQLLFTVLVFDR